jgi:hypothetical protein
VRYKNLVSRRVKVTELAPEWLKRELKSVGLIPEEGFRFDDLNDRARVEVGVLLALAALEARGLAKIGYDDRGELCISLTQKGRALAEELEKEEE